MSDLTSPGVQLVDLSDESPVLSKILDRMDDAIDEKRFSYFLNCLFFDFSFSRVISSDLLEKIKSIEIPELIVSYILTPSIIFNFS